MFATIMLLAALTGVAQDHAPAGEAVTPVEHAVEATQGEHAAEEDHGFDILHHIQDSREIELPFGNVIHLPEKGSWMLGPIDMTPTKHVVFLGLTGVLTMVVLLGAAAAAQRTGHTGAPRGRHNVVEAMVLFLRDQVVMPNIGHGGEKYAPFVITLFFFILFSNLLGLLPWGATATGNVSVTAALALLSF